MVTTPAPRSLLIDSALRLAIIAALTYACVAIMLPFLAILVWAILLAVMLWPAHLWLRTRKGMSNARSATLIGIVSVLVLLVPEVFAAASLGSWLYSVVDMAREGTLVIPPMPPRLGQIPFIGERISDAWSLASTSVPSLFAKYGDQLKTVAMRLGEFAAGIAGSMLSMLASFVIAAIMLAWGTEGSQVITDTFVRLTGNTSRGAKLVALSAATIRGVLQGVVGVAFVQAVLLGIGLFAAEVPFAGALALLALFFGILQIPAIFIALPTIIWVYGQDSGTTALIFAVYMLIAGLSDNVLKPLMLGRGLEVPMPVILIGVIGGMIVQGLIGLFVGPVVLGLGYVLFLDWLHGETELPEA